MSKQVYNPYMPTFEYVPDGEPHVFGGRIYLYAATTALTARSSV